MRLRLALAISGLGILSLVPALTQAAAARRHVHLLKSEPAANDTVAAPQALRLWFSERVELKVSSVKLVSASGKRVALGTLAFSGKDEKAPLVAPVPKALAPGAYAITWTAGSDDGHPAKGSIDFVVKSAR